MFGNAPAKQAVFTRARHFWARNEQLRRITLPRSQPNACGNSGTVNGAIPVKFLYLSICAAALATAAGAQPGNNFARTPMADNPFAQPSTLPFELPPFDRIHDDDFLPAYEAGMAEDLREVAAIAHNPQPPTFDNTIVALERSGVLLQRVDNAFGRLNACNTNAQMQKIDTQMAPRLAAHADAIQLDPALWARVDALYAKRATLHLDPEQLQLLTRYHTEMVRDGARL